MATVSQEYYANTYFGEPVAMSDFPRLEATAERFIDQICEGRYNSLLATLEKHGCTSAMERVTTAYKNAICAQIEYYVANGTLSVTTGQSGAGFTVGKVTVQGSSNDSNARGAMMISPSAQSYLEQTGLLGRAVSVPVDPYAPFPVGVW